MDFYTFMSGAAALAMFFARCAQAGLNHNGPLPELLPVLRYIGTEGEKAMFEATSGVNTQKGLLFSLGLLSAAAALVLRFGPVTGPDVLATAGKIAAGIVERELSGIAAVSQESMTSGQQLYYKFGVTGIRGEAEQGLPAVVKALPVLREALNKGLSVNDALVQTLLVLMTLVDDTTVMHRHNLAKMRIWVRAEVQEVLAAGGMFTIAGRHMVKKLDERFIAENVSPGGAADLLAAAWFIYRFEAVFNGQL